MKTIPLSLIFFLIFPVIRAQDYLISFTATGASSAIDTIHVENLVQGTGLTMGGTDILHLVAVVGVPGSAGEKGMAIMVYPNPMPGAGSVEFELPEEDITTVALVDVSGKVICSGAYRLPAGRNAFRAEGIKTGFYSFVISSGSYRSSGKLISTRSFTGESQPALYPFPAKEKPVFAPTGGKSVIPMQYNDGDQLLITCYSDIYTTLIPLVPVQSMNLPVNFVPCTDDEGHHYSTVDVGGQVWMAGNLNAGIRIDGIQNQADNGVREKYCFDNNESDCSIYGGLYQWNEMMQYDTTQGVRGLCPDGWHLPADSDWTVLTSYLGGENVAGGKMKETGVGHWLYPNGDATNSSGFTALPGGFRFMTGSFSSMFTFCYFWSSSQYTDLSFAWYRDLRFDFGYVYRDKYNKSAGYSVRCILD